MVRTCDEDWMKKCMEFRVEGRRPVGIPKRTWLESVDADMAELEIDKEDVHDRKKWRTFIGISWLFLLNDLYSIKNILFMLIMFLYIN